MLAKTGDAGQEEYTECVGINEQACNFKNVIAVKCINTLGAKEQCSDCLKAACMYALHEEKQSQACSSSTMEGIDDNADALDKKNPSYVSDVSVIEKGVDTLLDKTSGLVVASAASMSMSAWCGHSITNLAVVVPFVSNTDVVRNSEVRACSNVSVAENITLAPNKNVYHLNVTTGEVTPTLIQLPESHIESTMVTANGYAQEMTRLMFTSGSPSKQFKLPVFRSSRAQTNNRMHNRVCVAGIVAPNDNVYLENSILFKPGQPMYALLNIAFLPISNALADNKKCVFFRVVNLECCDRLQDPELPPGLFHEWNSLLTNLYE